MRQTPATASIWSPVVVAVVLGLAACTAAPVEENPCRSEVCDLERHA